MTLTFNLVSNTGSMVKHNRQLLGIRQVGPSQQNPGYAIASHPTLIYNNNKDPQMSIVNVKLLIFITSSTNKQNVNKKRVVLASVTRQCTPMQANE